MEFRIQSLLLVLAALCLYPMKRTKLLNNRRILHMCAHLPQGMIRHTEADEVQETRGHSCGMELVLPKLIHQTVQLLLLWVIGLARFLRGISNEEKQGQSNVEPLLLFLLRFQLY